MKQFDSSIPMGPNGNHLINQYSSRRDNGESFAYEAEYIAQANIQDVWLAIQQLQYFSVWFSGYSASKGDTKIPDRFGLGQQTAEKYHPATFIQFSQRDGVVFRHNDAFFRLNIKDYGPTQTHLRLRCFDYLERPPGIISRVVIGLLDKKDKDQRGDIESTRIRLMRLSHLAEDLKEFGAPVIGEKINGKRLYWIEWTGAPGILHVLRDEQGNTRFSSGQIFRNGKIGYVIPDDKAGDGRSEGYFIENYYFESSGAGSIVKVGRNQGESVKYGDRLLLVEYRD